ncbi:cytochrome c1 [Purpureocillium lavendulum]|uniref:Cytochrome c1 n=1 Tax=Purpureocillium lavendulum TaxID=1247861 RepID=A0AB34G2Z1_9HYPO|nr:cytochrome c1 [Purpureocillium lavendulum]
MATANEQQLCRPSSPETSPTLAIGACPDLSRCVSTASSASHGSQTDVGSRDSLGSGLTSRHSSASFHSRHSDVSNLSAHTTNSGDRRPRRRGYVRPQATYFAASARSRESVMNLGSIAHLQYYFARTGLLDGKGGQLARKKQNQRATLDMSTLEGLGSTPVIAATDTDSSYSSMGGSPDLGGGDREAAAHAVLPLEDMDDEYFEDSFAESDPGMLPPTVSTYHHRAPQVPKPPTIVELKADLEGSLQEAAKSLKEVEDRKAGVHEEQPEESGYPNMPTANTQGWYELQGMHILDVVTLAIRAAKMYYTAHELPDRLDSIKAEKQVRADLLAVMETLKQMATRNFKGGMKDDEIKTIQGWIESVFGILRKEEAIEATEKAEQASWTWLSGDWSGRDLERERAFLMSMDSESAPLPEWTPVVEAAQAPTPFLKEMQNGVRLVKLHNAVVKKSRRRFGAIPTFHIDTQKPYRCADNLRYWVKAAELRFEVMLKVDALGVAQNSGPEVWQDFETAILKWCRQVREEVTCELAK